MWSYDRAVEHALSLQQGEVKRVQTVINMAKAELGASLADYAAWNEMADFIRNPTDEFIQDDIGSHAFESNSLNGIFIFDPNVQLVWGLRYDYETGKEISYDSIRYRFGELLVDAMRKEQSFVDPTIRFIVIDNAPFIIGTSRVCNSGGSECNKGYLIFLKQINDKFLNGIEQATGISTNILVRSINQDVLLKPISNITYLEMLDYRNHSTVLIQVNHSVKIPPFIRWQELSMLAVFSVLMFFFNLIVVNKLVKPITDANKVLDQFQNSGGKMPHEGTFISKEMKAFSRTINQIVTELETSRTELKWQLEHDPLTRIANRRRLEKVFKSYITRYKFRYITLFLIDIDHFKLFNDNYGHLDGDKALKAVAECLESLEFDGRGEKLVARFGGEEFCVVLASDMEIDSELYGEKLVNAVELMHIVHQFSPSNNVLSISVGGVEIDTPKLNDYLDFYHAADRALYSAKAQGRGRYLVQKFQANPKTQLSVQ